MLQVYIMTDKWFFKVMSRKQLEEQVNGTRIAAADSASLEAIAARSGKTTSDFPKPTSKHPLHRSKRLWVICM